MNQSRIFLLWRISHIWHISRTFQLGRISHIWNVHFKDICGRIFSVEDSLNSSWLSRYWNLHFKYIWRRIFSLKSSLEYIIVLRIIPFRGKLLGWYEYEWVILLICSSSFVIPSSKRSSHHITMSKWYLDMTVLSPTLGFKEITFVNIYADLTTIPYECLIIISNFWINELIFKIY